MTRRTFSSFAMATHLEYYFWQGFFFWSSSPSGIHWLCPTTLRCLRRGSELVP